MTGLPQVLFKGIGAALARLIRDRCQAAGFQVELRRFSENNSDLLHRSNTPSYLFALGLVIPWAALLVAVGVETQTWGDLARGVALGVPGALGPLGGWLALRRAHLLLPPLATLSAEEPGPPVPPGLLETHRSTLQRLKDPELQAIVRRLVERFLVIHSAQARAGGVGQLLLEGPRAAALDLVLQGLRLASQADEAQRRLDLAGEAALWEGLEALRARLAREPEQAPALRAAMADRERALEEVAQLERQRVALTQQLLRLLGALELASVQALSAAAQTPEQISAAVLRLKEEATVAAEVAVEVARSG